MHNFLCDVLCLITSYFKSNVDNHSSLSSRLSPGEAALAGSGDFEGVRERFGARAGDLDAERLLDRE